MQRRTAASLVAATVLALSAAAAPDPKAGAGPPVRLRSELGLRSSPADVHLFTHARIVVSPERTIEAGEMLVAGGRVVAVGERVEAPAGVARHDLGGLTVLPGFVDPFTDYGLESPEPPGPRQRGTHYESDLPGAGSWNEAVHAERDWVDAFEPDAKAAAKLRERGVVAVQSARLDGVFRGRAFVVSLADGPATEVVLAPATRHFAAFDKGSSLQEYPSSLMGSIALVRQTLLDAGWYGAGGKAGAPAEVDRALAALAANRDPIVFESGGVASLLRAARIGEETGVALIHLALIHLGSGEEWQMADAVAATGDPLILPLTFPKTPPVSSLGDELDVTVGALRHWERAPGTAGELASRDVELALSGHGLRDDEDFLVNLRTAVARGLDPARALAGLTTVPARLAGVGDRLGDLEPGKDASFVVVRGDLFRDDEAEVVAVWIAGEPAFERDPPGSRDYRGGWELRVGEHAGTLTLRGDRDRLRGKLKVGEASFDLEAVAASFGGLTLVVPAKAWGLEGTIRVDLATVGDAIAGEAALADGTRVAASLAPDSAVATTPNGADPEAEGRESRERERRKKERAVLRETTLASRPVFPNVGLGLDAPAAAEDVLVRGATVWTLEGEGVLEGADLLVRGGRIAAVGRDLAAPAGARVIDASGRHVSPGILDEHSHLAIAGGVNEGSHAVTSEVRIGDVVDPSDVGIWRALGGGVTAAQLLHGSANPIGGQAQVIKLRWGRTAEELKLAGAPPSIKFALGENVKQSNWGDDRTTRYPQTRMGVETLMRDRFLRAREYAEAWKRWDALPAKERQGRPAPRRDLQLEALVEILAGERTVHCHSYVQSEILSTMRLAEELGFRIGTFTHILEGYKVAPEMAAHGAGASSFSDWWAYKFEVYDAIPHNTCLLHRAGVVTSVNSDSEELIRHLNQEAAKSVLYCGMSEVEALKLATLNPAKQLGIADRVGSLAVGKDADFVIWSGHPLSTASRADETWIDGAPVFTRALDAELRARMAEEKQALVQKALRAGGGREDDGPGKRRERQVWQRRVWHCEDVEDFWHDQAR